MIDHASSNPHSASTSRRQMILGTAITVGALALHPLEVLAATDDEITRTSAAIHNRRTFKASPKRVYEALTNADQFHKVTMMSEAMKGGMPPGAKPTVISPDEGGSFTLFGGVITGRHIELVSNARLVQAWRVAHWKPGEFSLITFDLAPEGTGTALMFEHTGFPDTDADHLNAGWQSNYWEPLTKFFA
ncbi:MAG TPA: SRPBCC domain-containing protein [Gemmatimonadaceae bacterium]